MCGGGDEVSGWILQGDKSCRVIAPSPDMNVVSYSGAIGNQVGVYFNATNPGKILLFRPQVAALNIPLKGH